MEFIELTKEEMRCISGGSEFSEMVFYWIGRLAKSATYANMENPAMKI